MAESDNTQTSVAEKAAQTPGNEAPAKKVDTSGAAQQIVKDVDMSHPAVDDNPRARTSALQNRIDFNDPGQSGHDAVAQQLAEQGSESHTKRRGRRAS
jgi:hypothetical protein